MGSRPSRRWLTLRRHDDHVRSRLGVEALCGVDEVGRGPLAGPVVAAAVILPPRAKLAGLDDSKLLEPEVRAELALAVRHAALAWAFAVVGPRTVDRLNILHASMLAMRRAVGRLSVRVRPEVVLVDGNRPFPGDTWPQETLVGGDGRSLAVAAASVVAKVVRDRFMERLDAVHPEYGFARNKGYFTAEHAEALRRHGPCWWHRYSFAPVRQPELFPAEEFAAPV